MNLEEAAWSLIRRTTERQQLPLHVSDPVCLAKIASILRPKPGARHVTDPAALELLVEPTGRTAVVIPFSSRGRSRFSSS